MGKTRRRDYDGVRLLPTPRRHERRTVKDRLATLSLAELAELSEDDLYWLEDEVIWPENDENG